MSRSVRVVFLTHNFPRFDGDISGAFLATLARALIARGHDIRVVAPSDGGQVGDPVYDGIPVRRVRYGTPAHETLAYRGTMAGAAGSVAGLRAVWALCRALRRGARQELSEGAELVHAHWWIPAALAAPPEAPLVLTSHGTDVTLLRTSRVAPWLARPVYRRARVVTAVSTRLAEIIAERTGRQVAREMIRPMPVPTDRFNAWAVGGQGLFVIGRLSAQKRVALVLRAVQELHRRKVSVPLTLIGDGPERPALERLAAELSLGDTVRFAGPLPPAGIPAALMGADALVFAAKDEGFGLTAAEALMAGVPVVACEDGGGVLDIVPREAAGRIAAAAVDGLASAIAHLLKDPERHAKARVLGAEWRERLNPARAAEAFEGFYVEALRE